MKYPLRWWITFLTAALLALPQFKATGAQSVSLSWDPSMGTVAGYNLYLGTVSGQYNAPIDVGTNLTVTVASLSPGQTNYFVVTAYNSARIESVPSNVASYVLPATPTNNPPPVTNTIPPVTTTNTTPPVTTTNSTPPVTTTNNTPPVTTTNTPPATNTNTALGTGPQALSIVHAGSLTVSAPAASNLTCVLQGSTTLSSWTSLVTTNAAALSYTIAPSRVATWSYYRAVWVAGAVNAGSIAAAVAGNNVSPQIVGFVTLSVPPGYASIANPFYSSNNTVAALLPAVPANTVLCKYVTSSAAYVSNVFSGGAWTTGSATLNPGEGGFLLNPAKSNLLITFAGNVLRGTVTNSIPAGYSFTSAMIPLANSLGTIPAANGDQIQSYANNAWLTYTYLFGYWFPVKSHVQPLALSPGMAFFITKKAATNWVESY